MFKEIKLVRVDNRLIHAQIILKWLKHMNINHIIVVDNEISSNPFLSQVYKLTTPPNLHIEILSVNDMIQYYGKDVEDASSLKRTMIIMKYLTTVVELSKAGIKFDKIQMGDTFENGGKRNQKLNDLKDKYENELTYLERIGTHVYYHRVPEESKELMNSPII